MAVIEILGVEQNHSLQAPTVIAVAAMIGGLFLFLSGYGELGFYLVLFGRLALWSMRHAREKLVPLC